MPPKRKAAARTSSTEKIEKKVKNSATKETKKQVVIPVDTYLANSANYKVYQTYSATLNQSNIGNNNNKFYIVQILQDQQKKFYNFNRWGRIGVPGQQAFKSASNEEAAIKDYEKKIKDKTKGGYVKLEIKFDDSDGEEEEEPKKTKRSSKSDSKDEEVKKPVKEKKSNLSPELQDLIRLIFDPNMINNAMKEIGYDSKKMPLGKLGDSTIKEAYQVLTELSKALKENKGSHVYGQLSSKFYTLIPHDFGFAKMQSFILDTGEKLDTKVKMLSNLTDMKLATNLIEKTKKKADDTNLLDTRYKSLNNTIKHLPKSHPNHKDILDFIGESMGNNGKCVKEIFTLNREADQKRYNTKIGNDQYLWHGSRLQNYVGILSQGLRIAPPEAPVNGYVYGKGLYFANAFATSTGYCYNYNTSEKIMLLCKVAVGKEGPLKSTSAPCIESKYDSCIGFASQKLSDKAYTKMNGIKMPYRGAKEAQNAYIVYDINQASLEYLIRFE